MSRDLAFTLLLAGLMLSSVNLTDSHDSSIISLVQRKKCSKMMNYRNVGVFATKEFYLRALWLLQTAGKQPAAIKHMLLRECQPWMLRMTEQHVETNNKNFSTHKMKEFP